jgi:hypothetical protein
VAELLNALNAGAGMPPMFAIQAATINVGRHWVVTASANGATRNQHSIDTIDGHVRAERFVTRPGELYIWPRGLYR